MAGLETKHMALGSFRELTDEALAFYRQYGFIHVQGIIPQGEIPAYRDAAMELSRQRSTPGGAQSDYQMVFQQMVNVWRDDETMKRLTLHPNVARAAETLAGVDLRLWHDQILIKAPHNQKPTEFHQDQPYWPHEQSPNPISAWIALVDVPVERGCMSFIPQSHRRTDLAMQNLTDPRSLFDMSPELVWAPRVTLPLKAGDCTFHHGRCAHMATPNFTDEPRVAHVVIFMDATVRYTGRRHVVTDPLELQPGQPLEHELFPTAASIKSRSAVAV
jgi:phytanoyl-CoA hydroxylase